MGHKNLQREELVDLGSTVATQEKWTMKFDAYVTMTTMYHEDLEDLCEEIPTKSQPISVGTIAAPKILWWS